MGRLFRDKIVIEIDILGEDAVYRVREELLRIIYGHGIFSERFIRGLSLRIESLKEEGD